MYKIAITGTKGKTTVARLLASLLDNIGENVILVDTDRAVSLRTKKSISSKESLRIWGLGTAVCPGRFLSLDQEAETAVLECSVGCGRRGLGYKSHDVGIFTNVFSDHISKGGRIKNRSQLAREKSFILEDIKDGGSAVINLDDKLVVRESRRFKELNKVGVSLKDAKALKSFRVPKDYQAIFYEDDGCISLRTATRDTKLLATQSMSWTFDGKFKPSIYNLMYVLASVYLYYGEITEAILNHITSLQPDPAGGRLNVYKLRNGATLIADFAHEKNSLKEIAVLSKSLAARNIGILRLASRPPEKVVEVARAIAKQFDLIYVYNKVDGEFTSTTKPSKLLSSKRTFELFFSELKRLNPQTYCFPREDQALEQAAKDSLPSDCLVHIVGLDVQKSLDLIKKTL